MALEVEIDRDVCMGSGNCTFAAPGAFALDNDSIAVVEDLDGVPEEQILAGARQCPTQAITVRRDGVVLV